MKYKLIILDIDGTITTHISSWRYIHEKLGIWTREAFNYQDLFWAGKISYRKFCNVWHGKKLLLDSAIRYTPLLTLEMNLSKKLAVAYVKTMVT